MTGSRGGWDGADWDTLSSGHPDIWAAPGCYAAFSVDASRPSARISGTGTTPMVSLVRPGRRNGFRGQALVEFAIVLPIFLLLLFAMIDVGRWIYARNNLNEATREAARGLVVEVYPVECLTTDTRNVCATKVVNARVFAQGGPVTTTTTCWRFVAGVKTAITPLSACTTGDFIRVVAVVDPWTFITPIVGQFVTTRIDGSAEVGLLQ